MTNEKMLEFINQYYINNKQTEIAMERLRNETKAARIAAEEKNTDIANNAVDTFTKELMEGGLL